MKKTLLLGLLLLMISGLFAAQVPINEARTIAKNIYFERVQSFESISFESVVITEEFTYKSGDETIYYAFNIGKEKGWVIVSAIDNVFPVLAYSFKGSYNENDQHVSFKEQMNLYEKQIVQAIEKKVVPRIEVTNAWATYKKDNFKPAKDIQTVGPWCETSWDQSPYYNDSCPGGSVVGCVATAMAQILRYFEHPVQGEGQHSYTHPAYGVQSANFGNTVYNYANMPMMLSGPNADVAQISYHCGVSVNMSYSPGGSGASMWSARDAFAMYFKYYPFSKMVQKGAYSDIYWKILIRAEHINARPVMYSGPGHAFICDGFQYPDHFHFNWGWGGSYDGYYYMDNLTPGYYNFTNGQDAIIDNYPDNTAKSAGDGSSRVNQAFIPEGEEFNLMPNPSNGKFKLALINQWEGDINCSIMDASGRLIKTFNINKDSEWLVEEMDLMNLGSGIYMLSLSNGSERIHRKFIINN
jgi:hypothetical protein